MKIIAILKDGRELESEIEESQLHGITKSIKNGDPVVLGSHIVHGWQITEVMTPESYEEYKQFHHNKDMKKERISLLKSGQWYCRFGYWHVKGQECGHNLQYGGQESTESEYEKKVRDGEYDFLLTDQSKQLKKGKNKENYE